LTLLLVGSYKKFDTNEYVQLLADEYIKQGIQVIFEEQNFLFSNFIPNVVHIQWPESIYRWKKLIGMDSVGLEFVENRLQWYKENKTKFIYTVHNLQPHDDSIKFDNDIYALFLKYADIIVHHGKDSIDQIKQKYKETINSNHIVAPHGAYKSEVLPSKDSILEKYTLPKNKIICTNFGLQRSYKGRDFNIEVFKNLNLSDICYFCVGMLVGNSKPFEITQKELCHKQLYKKIPSNEVPEIISATDIFFLGHSSGLNSGLIPLAISYSKPVIFPDISNFKEQALGWEYFETYEIGNIDSAIQAILRMIIKLQQINIIKPNNSRWLLKNSWKNHVSTILKKLTEIK
jgi:hypothetical protein